MFAKLLLLPAIFSTLALASPAPITPSPAVDTSSHCGQWDSISSGPYSVLLDLWGQADATSGSQCTHITSQSGNNIAWATTWTWTGGSSVKSFSNVQLNQGLGKMLSQIKSIQTNWSWSYSTTGSVVTDVAYDLFTASTPTGNNVNEIMIWLANINAGPIASSYSATGAPVPTVSNINLAGHTWNLFTGSNGANAVFSFLPTSGQITSFSGDINVFLQYLVKNQGVSASQYLKTAQAGTEPTKGQGTLTTSSYSMVIN